MTHTVSKTYSELYVDTFQTKIWSQASHLWLNLYTNTWQNTQLSNVHVIIAYLSFRKCKDTGVFSVFQQ